MTDINLLPVNEREKEWKEMKKKMEEKSKTVVELTSPKQKIFPADQSAGNVLTSSWWDKIKKWWGGGKKKEEKQGPQPIMNGQNKLPPQLPPTMKEVRELAPQKIFYQSAPRVNNEIIKKVELEPIKSDSLINKEVPAAPAKNNNAIAVKEAMTVNKINDLKNHLPSSNREQRRIDINLMPGPIEEEVAGKKNVIIIFLSLIISALIMGGAYMTLTYLITEQAESLAALDNSIKTTNERVEALKSESNQANDFVGLLKAARQVLTKHATATPVFDFLQKYTLRDVYYSHLQIDTNNQVLILAVEAKDYLTAAKQLFVFQSLAEPVVKMEVSNMALKAIDSPHKILGEPPLELVSFNLSLTLKQKFFYHFP